jgi:hypothetical protein
VSCDQDGVGGLYPLPSEEETTHRLSPESQGQNSGRDCHRAFAVKVVTKRLPVSPFSEFDVYHHFRNDAFYDLFNLLKVRKTGKREVVLMQPLPQTLYTFHVRSRAATVW